MFLKPTLRAAPSLKSILPLLHQRRFHNLQVGMISEIEQKMIRAKPDEAASSLVQCFKLFPPPQNPDTLQLLGLSEYSINGQRNNNGFYTTGAEHPIPLNTYIAFVESAEKELGEMHARRCKEADEQRKDMPPQPALVIPAAIQLLGNKVANVAVLITPGTTKAQLKKLFTDDGYPVEENDYVKGKGDLESFFLSNQRDKETGVSCNVCICADLQAYNKENPYPEDAPILPEQPPQLSINPSFNGPIYQRNSEGIPYHFTPSETAPKNVLLLDGRYSTLSGLHQRRSTNESSHTYEKAPSEIKYSQRTMKCSIAGEEQTLNLLGEWPITPETPSHETVVSTYSTITDALYGALGMTPNTQISERENTMMDRPTPSKDPNLTRKSDRTIGS